MTTEDIRSTVQEALAAIAPETDLARIRPDVPLRGQIELDSIDWVNVIARVSDMLALEIPASDYGQLATLDAIVAYVAARRTAGPGAAKTGESTPLPHAQHLVKGTRVTVRPMRREDLPLEAEFVGRMSAEARYQRFMVTVRELPHAKLQYLTDVDQLRHVALVAVVERDGRPALVGVVRYVLNPAGTSCEFAVTVDDAWQRSGLAGILMQTLMAVARVRGIATMEGLVLSANTRMLKFTRQLGFTAQHEPGEYDTVRVMRAL